MLDREKFEVLASLAQSPEYNAGEIAKDIFFTEEKVLKVLKDLGNDGYISDGRVSKKGSDALEPYRVKKAVFIAAGFGNRLVPATLKLPKPLVVVNGKRIIEGLLEAVTEIGIEDITIVRGYMGEKFDILKEKYPTIKFAENPDYDKANNILSAMKIEGDFERAYIFNADWIAANKKAIRKYQYSSNFLGYYTKKTDDWCFITENGYITEERRGGENCYHMIDVSYWDEKDGRNLKKRLPDAFASENGKNLYWEQTATYVFKDEFKIEIRECRKEDFTEIDTYEELKAIDGSYR